MITIYLTPENGLGVLTNGGIIEKANVDESQFIVSPISQKRYHSGYGGEDTWWHTSLTDAKKLVTKCKKEKIHLLQAQIRNIRKLPLKVREG